jgi:hypothetical protein
VLRPQQRILGQQRLSRWIFSLQRLQIEWVDIDHEVRILIEGTDALAATARRGDGVENDPARAGKIGREPDGHLVAVGDDPAPLHLLFFRRVSSAMLGSPGKVTSQPGGCSPG